MKNRIFCIAIALFLSAFAHNASAVLIAWDGICTDCTEELGEGSHSPASALFDVSGGSVDLELGEIVYDSEAGEISGVSYSSALFEFTMDTIDGFLALSTDGPDATGSSFVEGVATFSLHADGLTTDFVRLALNEDLAPGHWELFVGIGEEPSDVGFGSTFSAFVAVPEPGTLLLFGLGLLALSALRRRQPIK